MKDDDLNITSKTIITHTMILDRRVILESNYRIGGVQMTVIEIDVEKVNSH